MFQYSSYCAFCMMNWLQVFDRKSPDVELNVTSRVVSSSATGSSSMSTKKRATPESGSSRYATKDQATSSAVQGEPSWNVTSSRNFRVYVLPSSETSQLSATQGFGSSENSSMKIGGSIIHHLALPSGTLVPRLEIPLLSRQSPAERSSAEQGSGWR